MIPVDKIISFLISQALIWLPLIAGHRMRKAGWMTPRAAKPIYILNLAILAPVIIGVGIWKLDRSGGEWIDVVAAYSVLLVISTVISLIMAPRLFPGRASAGTFAIAVPLSNIGHTMAGFLTLLLLPDRAYPFNAILLAPLSAFMFLVWLPLAHHWGHPSDEGFFKTYWRAVLAPQSLPLVGIIVGLSLNFGGIPIPDAAYTLLKVLVYTATVTTMFAMGSRLHLRKALRSRRHLGWLYSAKFLVHPAIILVLCWLLGIDGLPAGALFIASCMPAGVNVVSFSTIYDLDVDLANAAYLLSTFFFMLIVLPILIALLHLPLFAPG